MRLSSISALPKSSRLLTALPASPKHRLAILWGRRSLLTTVSTVDPIKVYFPVSEREYLDYMKENPDAAKRAAQETQLALQLILADGSLYRT